LENYSTIHTKVKIHELETNTKEPTAMDVPILEEEEENTNISLQYNLSPLISRRISRMIKMNEDKASQKKTTTKEKKSFSKKDKKKNPKELLQAK